MEVDFTIAIFKLIIINSANQLNDFLTLEILSFNFIIEIYL